MAPRINEEVCTRCGVCADVCPGDVIATVDSRPEVRYPDECWHCGNCRTDCPVGAVTYVFPPSALL